MPFAQTLLPEFDHEMAGTRRMLEAVPAEAVEWRPHPKSTTLGALATHIAALPMLARLVVQLPELDFGTSEHTAELRRPFSGTAELVERFDRNVREAREALAGAADADLGQAWTLRSGGHTIFTLPRAAALRGFFMSHLIHHRGQLSVYLRLRDVPLPSLYGPTADTR